MRLLLWICVALACAAAPTAARRPKLAGKVLDAAAFGKVRTYCVDTSSLPGPAYTPEPEETESTAVRELFMTQSGPHGLLSNLPWKLEAACSAPGVDAVLRFRFRAVSAPLMQSTGGNPEAPQWGQGYWAAFLQVSDKGSSRVIYRSQGDSMNYRFDQATTPPWDQRDTPYPDYPWDVGRVLREYAAQHALAALASDVKTISKNP